MSSNYVEGNAYALIIVADGDEDNPETISGLSITNDTIAGNWTDCYFFGGQLPAIMNANQWGGDLNPFRILGREYSYSQFLAWAQANGFEQQSAGTVGPLISTPSYDQQLDANPTLDQITAVFRGYAVAQINSYPPSTVGVQISALAGIMTPTPTALSCRRPTSPTISAPGEASPWTRIAGCWAITTTLERH